MVNPDGSNRQSALRLLISRTHGDVAAVRRDAMHKLTTRLAKTHGVIVIEDLNVKGMMKKSGLVGGRGPPQRRSPTRRWGSSDGR